MKKCLFIYLFLIYVSSVHPEIIKIAMTDEFKKTLTNFFCSNLCFPGPDGFTLVIPKLPRLEIGQKYYVETIQRVHNGLESRRITNYYSFEEDDYKKLQEIILEKHSQSLIYMRWYHDPTK